MTQRASVLALSIIAQTLAMTAIGITPVLSQSATIMSKPSPGARCIARSKGSDLKLVNCIVSALIVDQAQNRALSCQIRMDVKYRRKTGGAGGSIRLVVDSQTSASECYVQPNFQLSGQPIMIDTGQNTTVTDNTNPTRIIMFLTYENSEVTACVNAGAAFGLVSETACKSVHIKGPF
jgi:hypothetical protein